MFPGRVAGIVFYGNLRDGQYTKSILDRKKVTLMGIPVKVGDHSRLDVVLWVPRELNLSYDFVAVTYVELEEFLERRATDVTAELFGCVIESDEEVERARLFAWNARKQASHRTYEQVPTYEEAVAELEAERARAAAATDKLELAQSHHIALALARAVNLAHAAELQGV